MISAQLRHKLNQVPPEFEKEIEDFIDGLLHSPPANRPTPERQFGLLKGKLTMAPDFDDPLDDFKEY